MQNAARVPSHSLAYMTINFSLLFCNYALCSFFIKMHFLKYQIYWRCKANAWRSLFSKAYLFVFSHEKFNLVHFKEPSFSAFPSSWAFKKYCKNCHIQCHTLEGTYIHNLPLHCCGTLHIHSLPTDTTSIKNLYTYNNLSYKRIEFKIILSTSNYMFYFFSFPWWYKSNQKIFITYFTS